MAWYYEHPDLVIPPDGTVIWRYMDLWKFERMLSRGGIFFSRADKQQSDKVEGEYPPAMVAEFERRFKRGIRSEADGANCTFLEWHKQKEIPSRLISCWSTGGESRKRWRKYTSSTQSFAIRSTVERLKNCFRDKSTEPVVWIGKVRYGEEENRLPESRFRWNINYMLYPFFAKKECYRWEGEIRATVNIALSKQDEPKGCYVMGDLFGLINSLWIHPQSPAGFKDEAVNVLSSSDLNEVGIYQSPWDSLPEGED